MIMAYKAFKKDLTCTAGGNTYQYQTGIWNEFPKADLRSTGMHCAENPLDCLDYYHNRKDSVYYLVLADGDISEDGRDSAISCTRMKLVRELPLKDFLMHALNYMYTHPSRSVNHHVKREAGVAEDGFTIVRGKNPRAAGDWGSVLAFAKEAPDTEEIIELGLYEVDGQNAMPGIWYNTDGQEVDGLGQEEAEEA